MSFLSALYTGTVFHRRVRPREHVLRYRVFSLLLDLDEIDTLAAGLWLFSRNRFNLFAFHDRDFGLVDGESLTRFVRRSLLEAGIRQPPDRVRLSCYPRVLGYSFNPLSLFYCENERGETFAIVHEVHNTFGERHTYVMPARPVAAADDDHWIVQSADKALFVSPFADMQMHYRFRLNVPAARQVVVIRALDDNGLVLTASYAATHRPLSDAVLLRQFLAMPFMTFKVTSGIHVEALRLWLKRVPWFSHRPKSHHVASVDVSQDP